MSLVQEIVCWGIGAEWSPASRTLSYSTTYGINAISINWLDSGTSSCKVKGSVFKHILEIDHFLLGCPKIYTNGPHQWYIDTGLGVVSNKPINSLAPGKFEWNFKYINFKQILVIDGCPNMNVIGLLWWSVNIGSGNGLVPSGTKPLPEPMLTQISVAIWCHYATMSQLNQWWQRSMMTNGIARLQWVNNEIYWNTSCFQIYNFPVTQ